MVMVPFAWMGDPKERRGGQYEVKGKGGAGQEPRKSAKGGGLRWAGLSSSFMMKPQGGVPQKHGAPLRRAGPPDFTVTVFCNSL